MTALALAQRPDRQRPREGRSVARVGGIDLRNQASSTASDDVAATDLGDAGLVWLLRPEGVISFAVGDVPDDAVRLVGLVDVEPRTGQRHGFLWNGDYVERLLQTLLMGPGACFATPGGALWEAFGLGESPEDEDGQEGPHRRLRECGLARSLVVSVRSEAPLRTLCPEARRRQR
jgi:hypothetical protein